MSRCCERFIFTACKRSCKKVMLLHVFVCPQGVVPYPPRDQIPLPGIRPPWKEHGTRQEVTGSDIIPPPPPESGRYEILLECFLIRSSVSTYSLIIRTLSYISSYFVFWKTILILFVCNTCNDCLCSLLDKVMSRK